jgi:hypothetical protein
MLYLAWWASPVLHQLHLLHSHPGSQTHQCAECQVDGDCWRVFSHSPLEPCSDPDHHHHQRPVHDEDHCLTCRLGAAAVAELPFVGEGFQPARLAHVAPDWSVFAPLTPALLTVSPRAPPPPAST